MTLPNWKAIPVRTKRSRKRLHNVIATEFNLDSWTELPNHIKRSKKRLFNYYAEELHLEEFKELLKKDVRSTREYYVYLKENANPSSAPTLTITVKSDDTAVSGASVTIGSTTKSTGSDGKASFDLEYGDYEATISASGYETSTEELKFRSNKKTFTITLEESTATSGTLTVTTVDSEQAPLESCMVFASDEQYDTVMEFYAALQQDPSILLSMGRADNTGEALMMTMSEEGQAVEPVITFEGGNHYLYAITSNGTLFYVGSVSIDGDTTTTITLTE